MTSDLRILYVGSLWQGGTCLQRMNTLKDLGYHVMGVDTEPSHVRKAQKGFMYRVSGKLFRMGWDVFGPKDLANANRLISRHFEREVWDILWIDKGLTIEAETLREIKARFPDTVIVGYSPDDMFARHNQSRQFLQHLNLYDIFFNTKSYGVDELQGLGCPNVVFVGNAFDRAVHKPNLLNSIDKMALGGAVGFIGDYEQSRASSMYFLAIQGIPIRIWGPNWQKCNLKGTNFVVERKAIWAETYSRALCAFDINLCFLRKINRDLQTTRSVEIPACGAFMLAERTDEHLGLFEEAKEAEFFSSDEELLDKTRYYLSHPSDRKRIAAAGRERCLKSGYSNHDRMKEMLSVISGMRH